MGPPFVADLGFFLKLPSSTLDLYGDIRGKNMLEK